MSFLQKARERAAEVAREAADATSRAAGAVSAKASDPGTQEKLKGGLASAGKTTAAVASGAAHATGRAAGAVAAKAQDPATQAKVRQGLASAGRGARTMVERVDPGILAEVIIKATALQEKANARLQKRGSIYRIGEIQVTASLPPGISFSIERVGDADHDPAHGGELHTSIELLAEEKAAREEAIVSLDTQEQAAIVDGLADAEASMDAAVDGIATAETAAAAAAAETAETSAAAETAALPPAER